MPRTYMYVNEEQFALTKNLAALYRDRSWNL